MERLDADDVVRLMVGYRDALALHREVLDRLNVYPVPDGDTGKNMLGTLEAVVAGLRGCDADLVSVCGTVSKGALMGSQGNSGVILCQVLRGLMSRFERADAEGDPIDHRVFAEALTLASEGAYRAVQTPVEGTILTVVRETAEAVFGHRGPMIDLLETARTAAASSLERTPDLLPRLAEAGVVDAGAAGFVLLVDAALTLLDGRPLPEPEVPSLTAAELVAQGGGAMPGHRTTDHDLQLDVSDHRYEVMYLLEAPEATDDAIDAFRGVWATIGDSIVVVGGDGIWNCHVHTNDIGAAIEASLDIGKPKRIRITDLFEQVEEERWVREADPTIGATADPVATGLVVVCNGTGQERMFRELKVQGIVSGGQTMNPSVGMLTEAVERVNAPEVIILPNNTNIVAAAEQVDALTDKRVVVLPTRSVQEGLIAAEHRDPESDLDANLERMRDSVAEVVCGEVTMAVRDSGSPVGEVAEGDWIGLGPAGIASIAGDAGSAAIGLLDVLITDEHGWVLCVAGADADENVIRRIKDWLGGHRPDVEIEVVAGNQPHYPYLFAVE